MSGNPIVKPTLGIMPEWCWREHRIAALWAAIDRYTQAGITKPCVRQWAREIDRHERWLRAYRAKRDREEVSA